MPNKSEMKLVNAVFQVNLNEMKPVDVRGRACYKVQAKTLPDDIVMNRVKYPADEIAKGFRTLNNKPAPLGHPQVDGWYVSGSDPEGINRHWCGAWNDNASRVLEDNGKYRIHHDIYIDIETAKQTDNGQRVLAAFEKGDVIHTSTGVLCKADYVDEKDYDWIARNIELDHNAILLDNEGAATPSDGVGVFVNQTNKENKHLTINSFRYKENDNKDLASSTANGDSPKDISSKGDLPMTTKTADNKPDNGNNNTQSATNGTPATDAITVSQSELAKVIGDVVETKLNERDERAAQSEKADLVAKVVAVNLLSEDVAKTLPVSALRELANNAGTKAKAEPVNGAPAEPKSDDGKVSLENMFAGYSINDHLPKPEQTN